MFKIDKFSEYSFQLFYIDRCGWELRSFIPRSLYPNPEQPNQYFCKNVDLNNIQIPDNLLCLGFDMESFNDSNYKNIICGFDVEYLTNLEWDDMIINPNERNFYFAQIINKRSNCRYYDILLYNPTSTKDSTDIYDWLVLKNGIIMGIAEFDKLDISTMDNPNSYINMRYLQLEKIISIDKFLSNNKINTVTNDLNICDIVLE